MFCAGRHNLGLTLIELLVVIILISLVAGLGGGMYAGSYQRLLVEKAAKELYVMARYARVAAIEHQRPYHLQMDQERKMFWLVTMAQDPNTLDGVEKIVNNSFCRPGTLASVGWQPGSWTTVCGWIGWPRSKR